LARSLFLLLLLLLNGSRGRRGGGGGANARGGPPAGDHDPRAARLPADSRGAGAAEAGAGGERGHRSPFLLATTRQTVAGLDWPTRSQLFRAPAGSGSAGGVTAAAGRRRK
jgi:hypothetical protein